MVNPTPLRKPRRSGSRVCGKKTVSRVAGSGRTSWWQQRRTDAGGRWGCAGKWSHHRASRRFIYRARTTFLRVGRRLLLAPKPKLQTHESQRKV